MSHARKLLAIFHFVFVKNCFIATECEIPEPNELLQDQVAMCQLQHAKDSYEVCDVP